MQAEWSNGTLMVKIVEQDGANTLILATRDADTQLWKLSHLHPRIQITCSSSEKPWSRATLITYTSHERNALCDWRYSTNCRGISWRRQTTALFWRRSRWITLHSQLCMEARTMSLDVQWSIIDEQVAKWNLGSRSTSILRMSRTKIWAKRNFYFWLFWYVEHKHV